MNKFNDILKGGDLRSIGKANNVIPMVTSQESFDELFTGLYTPDRKVVMRSADAIEKITVYHHSYLHKHKKELLNILQIAKDIELKWHVALLATRLNLTEKECKQVWHILIQWATDKNESKIVRVNSIQGLFNLVQMRAGFTQSFHSVLSDIEKEKIPSLNARIRKLKKAFC